jgi:hypothetical protein
MKSHLAADAVAEVWRRAMSFEAQFGKWTPTFNAGIYRMRRLIVAHYEGFSVGASSRTTRLMGPAHRLDRQSVR